MVREQGLLKNAECLQKNKNFFQRLTNMWCMKISHIKENYTHNWYQLNIWDHKIALK